jgi:UDP-N-acetylglucosamine/UDP-N-acetylgalactosamine diphosphorylase
MKNLPVTALREMTGEYHQEHVLKYWDTLTEEERDNLSSQLLAIDHEEMRCLAQTLTSQSEHHEVSSRKVFEPATVIPFPTTETEKERYYKAIKAGEQFIAQGKIGVFLVAGGQASRLGFHGPKGMLPVTPIKRKTLFELFAEKIMSISGKYDVMIPWYIMTSKSNHRETIEFFEKNVYFGLRRDGVKFFLQREIPALTYDGKYILETPSSIFLNPDGHGGSILALHRSGALEDMKARGIEELFYFQVDNPLVYVADPAFVGYHVLWGAQMSTKVVRKAYAEERVGVIGVINGKVGVIEYSDFPPEEMVARNEDGSLRFDAGNIAVHMINRRFIERLTSEGGALPYHRAVKKIHAFGGDVEGIKFEKFIFDALGMTDCSVTMEVAREDEFAPIKNKGGVDSPSTALKMQIEMFASWLKAAGVEVPRKDSGEVDGVVEINPLYALSRDEFAHYYKEKPFLAPGFSLYIE